MGARENSIQTACLKRLGYQRGILIFGRVNNNAVFDKQRGCYRAFAGIRGMADCLVWAELGVFPHGTMAALEFKTGNGRVSDEQRNFLQKVAQSGNTAAVIRSLDDLEKLLNKKELVYESDGVYFG